MKIAVCPGSFDPFTSGHEDLVLRALKIFDVIYIAVMENVEKNSLFTADERVTLIKKVFEGKKNVNVIKSNSLLASLVEELDACAIVKGSRNIADFSYELQLSMINKAANPKIETVIIPTAAEFAFVCSTAVRDVGRHGGDITKFVPASILTDVLQKLKKNMS